MITCGGLHEGPDEVTRVKMWRRLRSSGGGRRREMGLVSFRPSIFLPHEISPDVLVLLNLSEGQDECDPPDRGLKANLSKLLLKTMSS